MVPKIYVIIKELKITTGKMNISCHNRISQQSLFYEANRAEKEPHRGDLRPGWVREMLRSG